MTTAVVRVQNRQGNFVAQALLDSCSTVNLVTEKFAKLLNLPSKVCSVKIGAVDGLCTVSKYVEATVHSARNNFQQKLNFLIVPNIADAVPNDIFPREQFHIPKNTQLADL